MGGGVGRILSNIAIYSKNENEVEHIIITLEPTKTNQFEKLCKENNINVFLAENCDINNILNGADIVQLDWWHHPIISQFMINCLERVKCRLVVWSHISGCSYPNIFPEFVFSPEAFVFTTPYSYENISWTHNEREQIIEKSSIVVSSGIDIDKPVKKKSHFGFNVGYIGFLSYNKMHPNFVKYCENACNIPGIRFIVVGDKSYGKQLIKDVCKSKILRNKVIFTGYSLNVLEDLERFDVFGYPLNPNHYGTAENVLLEAMAAGIVPVVLNQCTEKYIVENMKTGLVVNNISEYVSALRWLYENPHQRHILGNNASEYIVKEYNIKSTIKKMNNVYGKVLNNNKKLHDFTSIFGETPYDWFLSCYKGDINNIKGIAFAETKGSVKHYLKYFIQDKKLKKIVDINERRIKYEHNLNVKKLDENSHK
jgi:glycosyltransferase involved in cell wall biosynthesis